jgi:hypothetical protein
VSDRLAIVAEPAAGGLAGLDGSFEWGEAATLPPGAAAGDAELVVALGSAGAAGREPDARLGGDAAPAGGADGSTGERLIATAGDRLWSRAPWPVRDDLFELPAPEPGAGLLIVTADEGRDAALLEKLAGRGVAARSVPELTRESLAAAAAVAFPPDVDADGEYVPGARREAVPATAFAALAARRPLIAPRARVTFGLHAGVDHLGASTDDDVVQWADALRAFPEAFAWQLALGGIAAERQRASVVYARLVAELRAAPRSAAPRG